MSFVGRSWSWTPENLSEQYLGYMMGVCYSRRSPVLVSLNFLSALTREKRGKGKVGQIVAPTEKASVRSYLVRFVARGQEGE